MTGVKVEETKTLFSQMHMANYVLGVNGKLLAAEIPPVPNKHGAQSMYQMAHNRHLFLLNNNA